MAVVEADKLSSVPSDSREPTEKRQKTRRPGRAVLLVLLFLLLAGGALIAAAYYLISPVQSPESAQSSAVSFSVEKGESVDSIASRLAADHLIRAAFALKLVTKLERTGGEFQAGHYRISPTLSTVRIHDILVSGAQVLARVTVPEGFTLRQVADRVQAAGITTAAQFTAAATDPSLLAKYGITGLSAEGFLFPDTYLFSEGYPAEQVVSYMIETFFRKLSSIYPDYKSLTEDQLRSKVILASIVEREYVSADEAPLIASVFYNRLDRNIRLESCATVAYVMTEQDGLPHPDRIFDRDLQRPSPYNTYLHRGLPPGAISNPGVTALKAAFFPAQTDYLYFVLKAAGATHHNFSRTLAEHDQQAVYYLKTLQ